MTVAEAAALPWDLVAPIVKFVGYIAVLLLGLALLRLISQ